MKGGIKDR